MATTRVAPGRRSAPRPGRVVRAWRLLWQVTTGVVVAVGAWLELFHVEVVLTLTAVGMLWALGATVSWLLRPEYDHAAVWVERVAPLIAVASLVLPGLLRLGLGVAVGVLVALAITSPYLWLPVLRRRRPRRARPRSRRSSPTPVTPTPLPEETLEVPDALGPEDLAQAWQSSFVALQRAESPSSRARIADARAACLDALELCDRQAFIAWLDHGARPGADPAPWFVARGSDD
ncbi:MAG: hypothetical protein ABWX84_08155 [Nocardioides sp.]